jgi:hypothetical protein
MTCCKVAKYFECVEGSQADGTYKLTISQDGALIAEFTGPTREEAKEAMEKADYYFAR